MFEAFARRGDVVLLDEERGWERPESDDAMLQLAEVLPNSICISRDRFRDYATIHPGIVNSGRVRGYLVLTIDNTTYIMIRGLKRAVAIDDMKRQAASVVARTVPEVKALPTGIERNFDDFAHCAKKADGGMRAGHREVKPSKRALAAILDLASCSGDDDWDRNSLLDAKKEARRVHSARRNVRLRARAIREGSWRSVHYSRKRRNAAGIAVLGARLGYSRVA
jgi:hypothetical protein